MPARIWNSIINIDWESNYNDESSIVLITDAGLNGLQSYLSTINKHYYYFQDYVDRIMLLSRYLDMKLIIPNKFTKFKFQNKLPFCRTQYVVGK